MEVKLSYFRQDGKLRATGRLSTNWIDYNRLLADVLRRSRLQNGLPGINGLADCYHILIEPNGHEPRLLPAQRPEHREGVRPVSSPTTTAGNPSMSPPHYADDD